MNRIFGFGIAIFFAVVGLAMVGGERQADAGHGCCGVAVSHGCGGHHRSGGGLFAGRNRCGGHAGHHRCGGHARKNRCGGLFGGRKNRCAGVADCCGVQPVVECCPQVVECCPPVDACGCAGSAGAYEGGYDEGATPPPAPAEGDSPSDLDAPPAPPAETSAGVVAPVRMRLVGFRN